jgi:hypothetical protein
VKHLITEEETILKYKKNREQQLQEEDEKEELFHDIDDADDADVEQLPNDSIGDNEPSSSKKTPKRRRYVVDDDEDDDDDFVAFKDVDVDLALKSDGKTQHSARRLCKKLNEEFEDDDETDADE